MKYRIGKREWCMKFLGIAVIFLLSLSFTKTVKAASINLKVGEKKTFQADITSYKHNVVWHWSVSGDCIEIIDKSEHYCTVKAVKKGTCTLGYWVQSSNIVYDLYYNDYIVKDTKTDRTGWTVNVDGGNGSGSSGSGSSGGSSSDGKVPVKSIYFDENKVTLKKGKTKGLYISVLPQNASVISCTWSTSNSSVATVKNGVVTGVSSGTAVITATTANGTTASCKVTVLSPVKSVSFPSSSLKLGKGDKYKIKPTINPSDCTDSITWSSSNPNVASVGKNGTVTAKKNGKATITLRVGSKKASCNIQVINQVRKITPKKKDITIAKGKTTQLSYLITPSNAGAAYTWTSSNKKIVTVTQKGKITAKKAGSATITVKASSGVSAKYKIKVVIPATGIKCSKTSLVIGRGKTYKLSYKIMPSSSTDKVSWKSSNSKIVSVNSSGLVTGKKSGTAWITLKAGKCSSKCQVTVKDEIYATSLNIEKTDPAVSIGKYLDLTCRLGGPEEMTDSATKVTWSSNNPSVASVNSSGKVLGINEGKAVITASLRGMRANYPIVVTKGPWVDISDTLVEIYSSYAVNKKLEKIYFDSDTGLTLIQSDPNKANKVSFLGGDSTSQSPRHIILGGVKLGYIGGSGRNILFELMKNTENTIDGSVFARLFMVDGEGTLYINGSGSDNCVEATTINFKGGTTYINRKNTSYYALRAQTIWIRSGATVGIQGNRNLYYASSMAEIAPDSLYVIN